METQKVTFYSDYSNAPEELNCVATLEDIKILRDLHEKLKPHSKQIHKICVDVCLYEPLEDNNWSTDIDYVIMHINSLDQDDITVYQYLQSSRDASDQIETGGISLNELEAYLKSK